MHGVTDEYIRSLGGESDPLLAEMLDYAQREHIPVILPQSAELLTAVVRLTGPKRCLEIGTAIGYSSQLILRSGGERLFTVEMDEGRAQKAKEYFARANLLDRVTVFVGDACEIVPLVSGEFDFVFLDGPKTRYPEYLPYITGLLRRGGVLVSDDVLWNGYVSGEREVPPEKSTIARGLDRFLRELYGCGEYDTSLLRVGEGMTVSIKK